MVTEQGTAVWRQFTASDDSQPESMFEKPLEPRGTGFGVPRLRGPLVERRTNRVNAELKTGF